MRIWTSKSESMVLSQKRVDCPLQVGGKLFPQLEEFKYLGVSFTWEGRLEWEIDRLTGVVLAVMRMLKWSVVLKKVLCKCVCVSGLQLILGMD